MTKINISTIEKCILRDLIKIEIKSLVQFSGDYGKFKYYPKEYAEDLFKLGRKLRLDDQQNVKAKKLYNDLGR